MRLSEQWLREWVNPEIGADQLVEQLTMAGLEVDSVTPVAAEFTNVVVGEVLAVERHPDADKLSVCQVNVGKNDSLNIVCGAPNVKAGMKVPVAVVGATIGADFKIKKAKLRGVESQGMICSEKELGLAETSEGIMSLSKDAPIGADFREYLSLNDVSIEVDLTPNRGDCASVIGIAREVSAINRCEKNTIKIDQIAATHQETFPVKVKNSEACPRYVGRVIKNIQLDVETPLWMRERLRRCGLRSIDPVVDVTNYVLLELGQPMHAFDLSDLSGGIIVRLSKKGETLTLLNEDTIELTENTLVIADHDKILAIAGVMGGLDARVTKKTQNVFLESAFFDPAHIAGRARQYGLQTDSSYRFERGVDYAMQVRAVERATKLLLDIVGGEPGPVIEVVEKDALPKTPIITLRNDRVEKLLGIKIPDEDVETILKFLGMAVDNVNEASWKVIVPSYRFDIQFESDLIEEVARIYGYHRIPVHAFRAPMHITKTDNIISEECVRAMLQARDYHEIISYSFVDEKLQKLLDPEIQAIALQNPLSNDMNVMRTTLWAGLLKTLVSNLNRQQTRIRLFETGACFFQDGTSMHQQTMLSGVVYGDAVLEQWGASSRWVDFYDIKADIEALLQLAGDVSRFVFKPIKSHALHPGKSAAIYEGDQLVGYFGALHPSIARKLDIQKPVYLFECVLDILQAKHKQIYQHISKFPAIRRDLAFVVDRIIPSQAIGEVVKKEVGKLLTDLVVFDVYEGENIEKTQKSIALGLTLQDSSRTLNDVEICDIIDRVIHVLESDLGAKLRD